LGKEFRLGIDLGERLNVLSPPLPEEQSRRPQLGRNRAIDV
jgi:hypothetical protein